MAIKKSLIGMVIISGLLQAPFTNGQVKPIDIEELKKSAPKIYIDCDWCDFDYVKTEITFVNYVRDRKEAQVHVLINIQPTGSG
ncbi:MAG: hypothetical protein OEW18_05965, partial [Candidatus Aminicenantes bacterium]|nr:hypothetical protein [Candidatus Aminicenantes bacterium]